MLDGRVVGRIMQKVKLINVCDVFPNSYFLFGVQIPLEIVDDFIERHVVHLCKDLLERLDALKQILRQGRTLKRSFL